MLWRLLAQLRAMRVDLQSVAEPPVSRHTE